MKSLITFLGGMFANWVITTDEGKQFANKMLTKGFDYAKDKVIPQMVSSLSTPTKKGNK